MKFCRGKMMSKFWKGDKLIENDCDTIEAQLIETISTPKFAMRGARKTYFGH